MTRFRFAAAATLAAAFATLAPVAAHAGSTSGKGMVPSSWTCTGALTGDVTFYLPAVAVSPGMGALIAPFPGFLGSNGKTYIVLAAGPIGGPLNSVGQKSGLDRNVSDCTDADFGAEVLIAPAG